MDLPLFSALFVVFSLLLYVVLDGFDLGVGALLLLPRNEHVRDRMVDSIVPIWDGNETWLIMAGVTLFAAFPIAYGILLPAFYLPLIVMLLALGLRGVSFEFRLQVSRTRWAWDVAFSVGSIVAALMQGLIVGGLIQGVAVDGEHFSGSVFDVCRPFCLLTASSLLAGYVVLGAGWLHLKGSGAVRMFAARSLRIGVVAFVSLAVASTAAATAGQERMLTAWVTHPVVLAAISVTFLGVALVLVRAVGGEADGKPFYLGLALFGLGVLGLGVAILPYIVPYRLTLWEAASATSSQLFVLIGALVVTPVVLGYSAFAYYVFRGKTPEHGWEI
jgi:cytochrome bd ubiquinol oxidase subunit II